MYELNLPDDVVAQFDCVIILMVDMFGLAECHAIMKIWEVTPVVEA